MILVSLIINLNTFVFAKCVFTDSIVKNEKKIEELILPCKRILEEAQNNSSSIKYVEVSKCVLKQDMTTLDMQTQRDLKNTVYSLYITNAMDAHKVTKQKKYLNTAYKISKKAVKNNVQDINILKTSMMIAALKGSPKNTAKAYTQMCEVDKQECNVFYDKYNEMYEQSRLQRKENLEWIKITGWAILAVSAIFAGAYAGASAANKRDNKRVTCSTVGNTTYCNEY